MLEATFVDPMTPVWVVIINVLQVLLVVWFGVILLLGSCFASSSSGSRK